MKKLIHTLYENNIIRYIFFGGCTTLVNLACFYFLRRTGMGLNLANFISIVVAIVFAYVVNARFVFRVKASGFGEYITSFFKFAGARVSTMVIEIGGVWLLVEKLKLPDMGGKVIIQFIVLALNYIFSRFLVFNRKNFASKKR